MNIPVSELIVRYMQKLGIECIFGMPGAHILPVYDSLYDTGIQTVLAKHEQGAAFMAGGYARATGRISACITTAGPGATNLVTGIANAYADKLPVLVITGETSTHIFGRGGLQESSGEGGAIDQSVLFQGITRYNKIVERSDYLVNVLNQASRILLSDTPGPVLLSFPYNVQKEQVDEAILEQVVAQKLLPRQASCHPHTPQLVQMLLQASNPVMVAGYGCIRARAEEEVAALAAQMNIPVTTSLKAKGVINEQSELSLGSLGVTSSNLAYAYIVDHADLVLFLGAGFNERTSYLWDQSLLDQKQVVQVDSDPQQLEKVFKADVAIQGDLKTVLQDLLYELNGRGGKALPQAVPNKAGVARQRIFKDQGFDLVEALFKGIEAHFPEGLVLFDDNIIFAQNFFHVATGNRYYPNSGISSLGHAIPAAIGARFALQQAMIAIIGDGGFQMCCMELMTAVNYEKPLTVIMFNNATMGLIRKNQHQQYRQRYIDCDFVNPDYAALARSFGIRYFKVQDQDDLQQVFEQCDFHQDINLVDVFIDKDVFPDYRSGR